MIDIQHSNERNFCGAITPKEKDKIMKAILDMADHERKTFCFTPNDVPNLKINGKQFEMVIMDFFEKGYIIKENISQYWDCSDIYPTCKLYEIAQFGGFKAAYEIKKANIQKMSLELELMGKKLESDFPGFGSRGVKMPLFFYFTPIDYKSTSYKPNRLISNMFK